MENANNITKRILKTVADIEEYPMGAFNIRENGKGIKRQTTENINIVSKEDRPGIDIFVKENTVNEMVHIPVVITKSGIC